MEFYYAFRAFIDKYRVNGALFLSDISSIYICEGKMSMEST